MSAKNAPVREVLMSDWQQDDTEQHRHEDELNDDWDNWMRKEPEWWQFLEWKKFREEQDDGSKRI